ncbi:hypothetical protein [Candidatus Borrarchaeum sp.]|uniref:hypothetical protein n=1 Tax=Candidatus Borrarchaeum sp. TaxID=2846742 RepID=UPI0025805C21|nr:hypothetical protein [Candidatus Borrarchaeum sp.]
MYKLTELTNLLPKLTLFTIKAGNEPKETRAWRIWNYTDKYKDVTMGDILKREDHAFFGPNHVPPESHMYFMAENMSLTTIERNIKSRVIETSEPQIISMLKEYRGLFQRLLYIRSLPDVDLKTLAAEGQILNQIDELKERFSTIQMKFEGDLPENILETIGDKAAWLHLKGYILLLASRNENIGYCLDILNEMFEESRQEFPSFAANLRIENSISVSQITEDMIEKEMLDPEISKIEAISFLSNLWETFRKLEDTPVDRFYLHDLFGKSSFRHSQRFKKANEVNYLVVSEKICKDHLSL